MRRNYWTSESGKLSLVKHLRQLNFSENASFIKTKLGQMHIVQIKISKGDEMIVINVSSIRQECGNYSFTFYTYC